MESIAPVIGNRFRAANEKYATWPDAPRKARKDLLFNGWRKINDQVSANYQIKHAVGSIL